MKRILLSAILVATSIINAQETVQVSMGAGYVNEVYMDLSDQTENSYTAESWDVAFLRDNPQNIGIRVNDGVGITVFEAANNAAAFDAIDVANEGAWTPLYNDDTNWDNGAFMQGSATYGWGEYNPVSHVVEGTIVFVLKYADGTYIKFINESYLGAYTFKFATWDGSTWINETTQTVENTSNPETRYNYFSLKNNEVVIAEPAIDAWDFVFRKYTTFLNPPGEYYTVTGVLHNPNVTVAQNDETTGGGNPNGLDYLEEINTIGYDWKSFNGSGYTVNSDMAFYVKRNDNTVYRVVFTEFEGSSSGNIAYTVEDVSSILDVETVTNVVSFGMYPNPSSNGQVTIVYENGALVSENSVVTIHAITGAKVYTSAVKSTSGFFNKTIDVSAFKSGVYLVTFKSGAASISKKLILN
ncbi:hypothetical protein ULMA_05300 [Patiriisocius marinus]|uniref:Secretion system C-terminal sorting domain-containing protein n=1 Tax=Patiriisocius marinus TaxID=1397112 RepID=A0A5J4IVV4_9FLAO|nr:T9SS type A sorting domain-containing protein [Patiriisocius marinus]GER58422.1 hypothetical protein ULMA_05300 [Patiriisocius marinus]